jgi:hypothetical protein
MTKYTINELANSKGVSQPVREALLQMADYKQLYEQVCEQYDILAKELEAIKQALAAPVQEPVLQDIEQYRLQMAGISTAAIGYWKESDGIHPDYDTPALRDVAKLYAKYDALYTAAQPATEESSATQPAQRPFVGLTDEEILKLAYPIRWQEVDDFEADKAVNFAQAIEAKLRSKNNG